MECPACSSKRRRSIPGHAQILWAEYRVAVAAESAAWKAYKAAARKYAGATASEEAAYTAVMAKATAALTAFNASFK